MTHVVVIAKKSALAFVGVLISELMQVVFSSFTNIRGQTIQGSWMCFK